VKILIVDEDPIVRAGLRRLLAAEPDAQIREAADGKEALTVLREQQPDLVVLDLNLPGIGGIEIISRLKSASPYVRVLILSMHSDLIHANRTLRAGAAG
jgi:two-component system, NarL family, invasion response regulator UvrY